MSKQAYCVIGLIACVLAVGSGVADFWPLALRPYFQTAGAVGAAISLWLMKPPIDHDSNPPKGGA